MMIDVNTTCRTLAGYPGCDDPDAHPDALVDVSHLARRAGLRGTVALTARVWSLCTPAPALRRREAVQDYERHVALILAGLRAAGGRSRFQADPLDAEASVHEVSFLAKASARGMVIDLYPLRGGRPG